ncbi:PAS domain-containing sensor histidine kinase [Ramlibacter henchirensis]|uniref:histidine kinase n=1 Tax=Ramlibacter henchirensis TaxID=204072 RepID=A0A4Z0BRU3_9BURK|nr:PAS domain-containing sensor histidine kinase [Ramlibacter henchirensis]TFZ00978.1 PAS domain-containing sensor histidine kinase [Ramlibacter henchirensis]
MQINLTDSGNRLADEAERLRLFISSVADYAIYMLSPTGEVVSWNLGAQRFKGYEPHEIIGKHFSNFYTPEDRAEGVPARALELARTTGKFEAEGWRVRKDGSRFWASVVIDPIRDEKGELIGFTKITRDITDKREAQKALRLSEERFRMLVQGVTDYAIYMLSPSGEITNWNAGARRIKGYDESEVIGSHFSRFYTDEDREKGMPANALRIASEAGRYEAEGWRSRKGGTRFWAHVVIDAIRDEDGMLVGFAKITRDITERKQAAEQLEKTREALFQSQKLEAIGKLTGGVAHDFNNLLNVLTNGLSMLRQQTRDADSLRLIDSMEKATNRATALTQQLLSFARQQPLRPEPRDVGRLVTAFETVLRRANRSAIQFEVQVAPRLPAILVDATQFETALLNLVVNARDATPDGGRITISAQARDLAAGEVGALPAGRYIEVSVADSGAGMSPEVLARAVEPFFTTKPRGKGTGLGLSQVYGLTQQSGGDVRIASRLGEGTTVSMFFPALPAEQQPVHVKTDGSEKVLVVDDQPEVLEMVAEIFRNLGFDVLTAGDGRSALNVLTREVNIGLLFSDIVMPGMNGIELANQVKDRFPAMKILLASGYPPPEAGDVTDFDFLSKPFSMADVAKKLRALAR